MLEQRDHYVRYSGSGASDNDVLFETDDLTPWDGFLLLSTTGAVDIFVSLDGDNFATSALSLQDFGASDLTPALVTVAGRVYGFVGKFKKIRVLQNGGTAASASLLAWNI